MAISAVTSGSSPQLVRLANGEYTAASVTADPKDASKLGLRKEHDGNYGTKPPASASAQSSPKVQSMLTSMNLGGK